MKTQRRGAKRARQLVVMCTVAGALVWNAPAMVAAQGVASRGAAAAQTVRSPQEAERMASEAVARIATAPDEALARVRQALAATVDFEPTAFVRAGRKGEVVEDDYLAARDAYRRHRSRLHAAVGRVLAARGEHEAAVRYLRRAELLGKERETALALAGSYVALGRTAEAQGVLSGLYAGGDSGPDLAAALEKVVDTAGWPSAQAEIDRSRVLAIPGGRLEWRDGPIGFPKQTRLSTAPAFRITDSPVNVIYAAEGSCKGCSEDVEALRRIVPQGVRVLVLPEGQDNDHSLRQVLGLFKVSWPVLVGPDLGSVLGVSPRSVAVVGRGGWAEVVLPGPPRPEIARVVEIFGRTDLTEALPRSGWNRRPVTRGTPGALPGLRPEGLAPGDDEPAPAQFEAALAAYREKRFAEAMRLLALVAERGDGWLLPAEARYDKALCLHALGRREEARKLLLKTGDSRFQDEVDRALERAGEKSRP